MVITEISNKKSQQLNARNQGMIIGIIIIDVNDPFWLLVCSQGKLGFKCQVDWKVKVLKGMVNTEISNEKGYCKFCISVMYSA